MPRLWGIADTHFWHTDIGAYADRPEGWHELIIANWNACVQSDDWVLHAGDFAFGRDASLQAVCDVRARLAGKIVLLAGNHDRRLSPKKWVEQVGMHTFIRDGGHRLVIGPFTVVYLNTVKSADSQVVGVLDAASEAALKVGNQKALYISHIPVRTVRKPLYYYGHVHNKVFAGHGVCLCVEQQAYAPCLLGEW